MNFVHAELNHLYEFFHVECQEYLLSKNIKKLFIKFREKVYLLKNETEKS